MPDQRNLPFRMRLAEAGYRTAVERSRKQLGGSFPYSVIDWDQEYAACKEDWLAIVDAILAKI